jgi:hypothetical protein
MPHRARLKHSAAIPVHVTLRVALTSLRSQFVFPTVRGAIVAANRRGGLRFRIVHYSVQSNHLHLVAVFPSVWRGGSIGSCFGRGGSLPIGGTAVR